MHDAITYRTNTVLHDVSKIVKMYCQHSQVVMFMYLRPQLLKFHSEFI